MWNQDAQKHDQMIDVILDTIIPVDLYCQTTGVL